MVSILVIADDLTGAAELGGVALRYGLSVRIGLAVPAVYHETDVFIINTNTRSLPASRVEPTIREVFGRVDIHAFDWIYLKFDSALRGHIYRELSLYRALFDVASVPFCPVNPRLGRVIRDGKYWVGDRLITETSFSRDPEFPIRKDNIRDILGAPDWKLIGAEQSEPNEGVYVLQVADGAQLEEAAKRTAIGRTVFAGAAAYFDRLLAEKSVVATDRSGSSAEQISAAQATGCEVGHGRALRYPMLYVCGSTHDNSKEWLSSQPARFKVVWDAANFSVEDHIVHVLQEQGKAVLALTAGLLGDAASVRMATAQLVKRVLEKCVVKELCIEGGATAYEVLKALEIDTFTPIHEWSDGVIRSKVDNIDLYLTLKPGSYPWHKALGVL